jgi:transposase
LHHRSARVEAFPVGCEFETRWFVVTNGSEAMPCFVGLDYAKRMTSICVVDELGNRICEGVAPSTPEAVTQYLRGHRRRYALVGMEASTPTWFQAGLVKARFHAVHIEALRAHGHLKANRNKTDRNDARGIAEMMRTGAFRPVHAKSSEARRLRTLLAARSLLLRKRLDLDQGLCTVLGELGLALKIGHGRTFPERAALVARADPELQAVVERFLTIRQQIREAIDDLEIKLSDAAQADPVCRRLMSAPGIGPLTALTFRAAVDDPARFHSSRDVGAHFGLTPRTSQSGEIERHGRISKRGDGGVRKALFLSALSLLRPFSRPSSLRAWGWEVAKRRGKGKAAVAVARRLAVILHRMWVDEREFDWGDPSADHEVVASSTNARGQTVEPDADSE